MSGSLPRQLGGCRGRARWGLTIITLLTPVLVCAAEEAGPAGVLGKTVWGTLQRGGEVMYVILGASIIGLAFIMEAAFRGRSKAVLPSKTARLLNSPEGAAAVAGLAGQQNGPAICRILRAGHRWRHGTTEQIQAAIEECVEELLWRYRRAIRPIGIIANVTPLLGLLGTVLGIIQAFDAVARQGALGDPSALAGGIAKALLTTGFGLIVAIPMLVSYHYLLGTIETRLHQCEEIAKEALILPPEEANGTVNRDAPADQ